MRSKLGVMLAAFTALVLVACTTVVQAEDYVLGNEDVIGVSVWLHPELERTVTINSEGNITYAPIGELHAAGLTPKQLAERLGDRLTTYMRQTVNVTVTVRDFLSHSIYVSGAVARPGRYGFERIPGLVDVISQAGGATPGADLTRVQLVRKEGEGRRTIVTDVSSALRDGIGQNLPPLQPGDTIILPASGTAGGTVAPAEGVGVLGEVNRPGIYPVGNGLSLWSVLATAGGLTARGNLADVRVVSHEQEGQAVFAINLQDQLKRGPRPPFVIRPGDVVVVGATGTSAGARTLTAFTQVLSVGQNLLNVVVALDVLKRNH